MHRKVLLYVLSTLIENRLIDFVFNVMFFILTVVFNEPLSFLQRVVEYGDYIELIHKAAQTDDPVKRIEVSRHISYFNFKNTSFKPWTSDLTINIPIPS